LFRALQRGDNSHYGDAVWLPLIVGAVLFFVLTMLFASNHMDDFVKILRSEHSFALFYLSGRFSLVVLGLSDNLKDFMNHPRAVAASIEAEEIEQAEAKRRSDLMREAQELFTSARAIYEHSMGATRDYEDAFECYGKVVAGMHVDGFVGTFTAQVPEQTRDLLQHTRSHSPRHTWPTRSYFLRICSLVLAALSCCQIQYTCVQSRTIQNCFKMVVIIC